MRLKGFSFVLLLVALAVSWPAIAQEQTGAIVGIVKDTSGGVLPGALVEARSPQVVGVSTSIADAQGIYRFPALPPGTYTVSATLQGFRPAKVDNVVVALGKMLNVSLTMEVGGVQETVVVTGEPPLIDVKQNAAFATIQAETIDRIPKGRDFTTILALAPGAQNESKAGGTQVDGASGSENRFIIDGMDTTALQTGVSGKTMLLDFIQEVQVKSSGYNAEFGGAVGGVVSAITKSGSNKIRGSVGTYFYNRAMDDNGRQRTQGNVRYDPYNSNKAERNLLYPENIYTNWNPIGDIGGPILKDKLWYYAGLAYSKTNNSRDVTFYSDPNRVERHFDWWSSNAYYNYNISTQITNNIRLKFSGSNQRSGNRGTAPTFQPLDYVFPDGTKATIPYSTSTFDKNADGSINQAAYDSRWVKQGGNSTNDTWSGNVDWVITPRFFVNAAGGFYKTNNTTPLEFRGDQIRHTFNSSNSDAYMTSQGFPTVPASAQQVSGYTDNISSSGTERNIFTRAFFNGNATFFLSAGGQHTFKAGVRIERFGNDVLTGFTKPNITMYWGQKYTTGQGTTMAGTYGYYIVNQTGTVGKVTSNNYSFWVQDSWTINNKLTINAGVRAENEHVPSYKDPVEFPDALSITFGFRDKIAPRVGFAYDIKGNGKWKAYGSYGHFFDITKLELPRGSFGGNHWINYAWTLNTADWASIKCGEGSGAGCPGTFIESIDYRHSSNQIDPLFEAYFNRPGMTGIDPNMKPVQGREFTSGLDHELSPTMSIGARYVHKWMVRTIEDVGIWVEGNEDYLISNPGEGFAKVMEPLYPSFVTPKPKRVYDGLEFRLTKRLSNNWSANVSYLYSRLYGNYSGLASSDENGRTSPNVNRYFDHTLQNYNESGKLVYGVLATDRPHTLKVQGTYDFKFGTSIGAFWIIESGTPQTTVVRFTGYPVWAFGRNDLGRSPVFHQMDLVVSQDVRLGGSRRVLIQLNVSNLFDQEIWQRLSDTQYGPQLYRESISLSMPPAVLFQPGGYSVASIVSTYKGTLRDNQFYKDHLSIQGRRSLRLMAKFSF